MVSGQIILIAVVAAGLWYGGHAIVRAAKKVDHKIASVFHHKKPSKEAGKAVAK